MLDKSIRSEKLKSIAEMAELITKLTGAFLGLGFIFTLAFGLYLSFDFLSEFGIPFTKVATAEDYVKATAPYIVTILFVALLSVVILVIALNPDGIKTNEPVFSFPEPIANKVGILIFVSLAGLIFVISLIGIYFSEKEPSDYHAKIRALKSSYGDSSRGIKMGHNGVVSIEYGKDSKVKSCLAFISDTGGMLYFWSLEDDSLFAVNNSQIVSITTIVGQKPYERKSLSKPQKRYKSLEHFLGTELGKNTIAWIEKFNKHCGKNTNR